MRRLPIYFLVDVSDSMVGQPREMLQKGLDRIVGELRSNPHALETAYLSIIAFAGTARTLVPLTDVFGYYNPSLPVGSGTSLGLAMEHLMESIDNDIKPSTSSKKGDWKPLIYILTDGKPTDGYAKSLNLWKHEYSDRANVIAIGLGPYADTNILSEIAENTFTYNGENEKDFDGLIRWISNSISAVSVAPGSIDLSKAVSLEKGEVAMAPAGTTTRYDEDSVILVIRCSKTGKPFLAKYDRPKGLSKESIGIEMELDIPNRFEFSGSHIVDEDYFEWSAEEDKKAQVDTSTLVGGFTCPYCGTQYGGACKCGSLICMPEDNHPVTCAWCKTEGLTMGEGDGGGSTMVSRSSG